MRRMHTSTILKAVCLGLLSSFVLSGCASLSKEECINAKWYAIGYEDGVNGRSQGRMGDHRKACAEYGVAPDAPEYLRGHNDGLRQFCLPGNGYRAGLAGRGVQVSCPPELSNGFTEAYHYGKRIYSFESEYRNHGRTLDKKREALNQVRAQQTRVEDQLVETDANVRQPGSLLMKSRVLLRREVQLENEIAALKAELENERYDNGMKDKEGKSRGNSQGNAQVKSHGNSQGNSQGNAQVKSHGSSQGNSQGNAQVKSHGNSQGKSQGIAQVKSHGNSQGKSQGIAQVKLHGNSQGNSQENSQGKPQVRPQGMSQARVPGRDKGRARALGQKQEELAKVRESLRQIDDEMEQRYSARQERRELLQESRRLTKQEEQLETEILHLERKQDELNRQAQYLKQQSPY